MVRSEIKLTLPLPCPLNRIWQPVTKFKLGRTAAAKSKLALLIDSIHQQLGGRPEPLVGDVTVAVSIYPRDRRLCDIDAYAKQLLDALQEASVLSDDRQVVHLVQERLGPQHPGRLEVELRAIGPQHEGEESLW